MDAVLQALADGSRRTVLEILRDHPATAGELADALPIARPGVSRHLRVLRDAGVLTVRAEGTRRYYALDPDAVGAAQQWLTALLDPLAGLANPLDALATEVATVQPEPGWIARYDAHYRTVYRPAYAALRPLHHAARALRAP